MLFVQNLPRRLSHCVLNTEPFERGDEYVSLLDAEGKRKDYCTACWSKFEKPTDGHYWKGKIPLKKEKQIDPDEKALSAFRQTTNLKQKYVLALYLQRKQQLIQRTKTLYEIPETGEVFDIEKVALTEEEGENLAKDISIIIDEFSE
jgi:hypothetical protein